MSENLSASFEHILGVLKVVGIVVALYEEEKKLHDATKQKLTMLQEHHNTCTITPKV